jgi:2-amino-4-hydroxy-6-hydroxymethyldihydropteridine diphosphokinase
MSDSSKELAYVSLGSNLGDRAGNLLLGIRGIMDAGLPVTRLSSIYESEPVETFVQPHFLNMVAELGGDSLPRPEQMMARLLRVEYLLGRKREIPRAYVCVGTSDASPSPNASPPLRARAFS